MHKILFIEDDLPTAKVYQEKFSDKFTVFLASNGTEGLSLSFKESPNLIVLDIMLGGDLNGFDVLRQLKQRAETKNIPVIVLTNLENQEKSALDSGANECLIKANTPIEKIEETIKKYLV